MLEKIAELKASLAKIDELILLSEKDNTIDKNDLLKERKFCLNEIKKQNKIYLNYLVVSNI